MARKKKLICDLTLIILFSIHSLSCHGTSYEPPVVNAQTSSDDDIQALIKISRGLQKIAQQASGAVVYVSITKPVEGQGQTMVDPFQFFFGPNAPFSMPNNPFDEPERQIQPKQKMIGIGSGFIMDLAKGYIITNNHVVEGADDIHLKLANGMDYVGKVVGTDPNTDIAVVQIKNANFSKDKRGGRSRSAFPSSTGGHPRR